MTQTESALGDAGDAAAAGARAAGRRRQRELQRRRAGEHRRRAARRCASSCSPIANQSDGAGTYLFGGQGATQKPFVDTPGGVQYVAATGQTVTENGTGLPLTTDGEAAWLPARTGNGVFVTSAAPTVLGATIDSGRVSDPSA